MDTLIFSTTKHSRSADVTHRRHYHVRGKNPDCPYVQDTVWPIYPHAQRDLKAKREAKWEMLTFDYCEQDCLD